MKKRHRKIKYVLLLALLVIAYVSISRIPAVQDSLQNPEEVKQAVLGFGYLAPLAFIFLLALQTTISIFPSQITTIAAGFIFGPMLGLLYCLAGTFLGSAFIFKLSQKQGKKLAEKLFEKKEIVHFHQFFRQNRLLALFLARIFPLFPNDLVSFTAGLTGMKFRSFNLVSTFGFLAQIIILTYFGAELSSGRISVPLIMITILIAILLTIVLFRKQIKRLLIKDLRILEKEIEKEFKKI